MSSNNGKHLYGRTAYEGFAKAIGARMGLNVQVVDGASACIDASGTIQLPGMSTYQTAEEFDVTCGTLVHELSHQFYGSHRTIDPKRSRLEHDCLNAVLDVADETWVGEWFRRDGNGRPAQLLNVSNAHAVSTNFQAYANWHAPNHAWKVLVVGILAARIGRDAGRWTRRQVRRLVRYTERAAANLNVDAKACFRLIGRARRGTKQSPNPTGKRFRKLFKLATELADLLKPFAPAADAANAATAAAKSALEAALEAGSAKADGPEATAKDGADRAEGPVTVAAPGAGKGAGRGAGRGSSSSGRDTDYDAGSYALLAPAVQRVAERIATDGDGLQHVDGLSNGPTLGQAHRLVTDGQCLARWTVTDSADGLSVSVLLDCSGSMSHHLAECAGIARSFAVGMRAAGDVQSLAFGCDVEESDFSRVGDMGGTSTDKALRRALDWLSPRAGRRWVVLITDGQPGNAQRTADLCREAAAQGVRILAVGIGQLVPVPFARCVCAADAAHLAIELDAAAQLIERD